MTTEEVRKALKKTSKLEWLGERMEKLNELLEGFGVEAIRGDWQNGYWGDIVAEYVNMGDTYDTTVIHVRGEYSNQKGRFMVMSWGTFVEYYGDKYGIM